MDYAISKLPGSDTMSYLVEKSFPFSFHAMQSDAAPEPDASQQLVFALLECVADSQGLVRSEEKSSDIERLEHKINLVIFLLNNLIQPSQVRPESHMLRLSADSIAWQGETRLPEGQLIAIELYLHPMISVPLRCVARVGVQEGDWCTAILSGLTEEGMSTWSKWVFRQHRYQVAQSREQVQSA